MIVQVSASVCGIHKASNLQYPDTHRILVLA